MSPIIIKKQGELWKWVFSPEYEGGIHCDGFVFLRKVNDELICSEWKRGRVYWRLKRAKTFRIVFVSNMGEYLYESKEKLNQKIWDSHCEPSLSEKTLISILFLGCFDLLWNFPNAHNFSAFSLDCHCEVIQCPFASWKKKVFQTFPTSKTKFHLFLASY